MQAWLLQPRADPCTREPGCVCLGATGPDAPTRITAGMPPLDATHACNLAGHYHPGLSGAGAQPPVDGGHYPPLWDCGHLQVLQRNLEGA